MCLGRLITSVRCEILYLKIALGKAGKLEGKRAGAVGSVLEMGEGVDPDVSLAGITSWHSLRSCSCTNFME